MDRTDHYIFDLDNTLVDSRKGYEKAYRTAFKEFDMPYDPNRYDEYIGTPLDMIFSSYHPNSPCKYRDFLSIVINTYENCYLDNVGLFPDAERCLIRLYNEGKVLGVVSNSYHSHISSILSKLDILELFSSMVGYDDVSFPKPDPEPVLLCMSEMNAIPERTIMIGDSENDIRSGKHAGIRTVLISRNINDPFMTEADEVIDSLDLVM